MASKLYFSRDTKVIAHMPQSAAATKSMFYDIPVLDGFSFSQATNTSEITLNEAQSTAGASRRGRHQQTEPSGRRRHGPWPREGPRSWPWEEGREIWRPR